MRLGINVFIRCFLFGLSASSSAVGHDTKQVSVGDDDMARRISAPTLVTNGERRPEFFYHLERCLPNRTRVFIPGASHTVPSENPQRYL
jgi:pimeloyl-ACP methyl ester carboxylesterase